MSGAFLQSTSQNFLKLKDGLAKNITKAENSFQDLIKNKQENLCKTNNDSLQQKIKNLINLLNSITRIIKSTLIVLKKLLQFISFTRKLIVGLTVLVKVLKLFPLPARWAIVGMIVKMGDLLARITFKLKSALLIITGVDFIVRFISQSFTSLLKRIQDLINNLRVISSQLLDCSKSLNNEANQNSNPELKQNLLDSSQLRANLGNELNTSLDDLNQAVNDLTGQFGTLLDSNNSYKGFTFVIIEEQTVEKSLVAKRRQAIALNANGILVLQGELSFATDTQVLIDELKLRIDNENLVGYSGVKNENQSAFNIDSNGNLIINSDGSITGVTSEDLGDNIDVAESEDITAKELGFGSINDLEMEAKNSINDINDLLDQDSNEKKLKSKFNNRQQRFKDFLINKSNEGDQFASNLLKQINIGQIEISEAKTQWLEHIKNSES